MKNNEAAEVGAFAAPQVLTGIDALKWQREGVDTMYKLIKSTIEGKDFNQYSKKEQALLVSECNILRKLWIILDNRISEHESAPKDLSL